MTDLKGFIKELKDLVDKYELEFEYNSYSEDWCITTKEGG